MIARYTRPQSNRAAPRLFSSASSRPSPHQARGLPPGVLNDVGIHGPQMHWHQQTADQHHQPKDGANQHRKPTAHRIVANHFLDVAGSTRVQANVCQGQSPSCKSRQPAHRGLAGAKIAPRKNGVYPVRKPEPPAIMAGAPLAQKEKEFRSPQWMRKNRSSGSEGGGGAASPAPGPILLWRPPCLGRRRV